MAVAAAAWFSVVVASASCAWELAVSGTVAINFALPAMISVHAFIGIGEAVITTLVVGFILKTRPDLIYGINGV
jgi:cobalt/nickel transport system permease protein